MYNMITEQWKKMIDKGMVPVFEIDTNDGPLIVDLELIENDGIVFDFDSEMNETYFSGDVETFGVGSYILPFDEYNTESLDNYLQQVYNEIVEGYLLPNDLI